MLFGRNGPWGSLSNAHADAAPGRGRPEKRSECAPVAPFERDPRDAAANAFDRVTGASIESNQLRTYVDMIAGYPVSAEDKFSNGAAYDRGATQRRHIKAKSIRGIGKETNRVDESGVPIAGDVPLEARKRSQLK